MKTNEFLTADEFMLHNWKHDYSGEFFLNTFRIVGNWKELAGQWFEAEFEPNKVSFCLEHGSKQMFPDYEISIDFLPEKDTRGIIVFDLNGDVMFFHNKGKKAYTEIDFHNVSAKDLCEGNFVYNGQLYSAHINQTIDLFPQFALKVFKTKGDGRFNIDGIIVESEIKLRCAGQCEPVIVFDKEGRGVVFYDYEQSKTQNK